MISAILLVITVLVSLLIVRVGAIAFEMTGLDREKARFQALSCFSGTGFTTREAEAIVGNRHRRKVASFLMILGNAGIVTVITTLVVTANENRFLLSFRNLTMITLGVSMVIALFQQKRFINWLGGSIRKWLRKTTDLYQTDVTEILRQAEGYCVSRLHVPPESPLADKTIASSGLRARDILVLSIERSHNLIPMPTAERVILAGDGLICYGPIRSIRELSRSPRKPAP